jgi:hypothetical protein
VAIQARPYDGAAWRDVATRSITAAGSTRILVPNVGATETVQPWEAELRVETRAVVGTTVFGVTATAPFLATGSLAPTDLALLSPRARAFDDLDRVVSEAEDDVLKSTLVALDEDGRITGLRVDDPRLLDQVRLAIARQIERRVTIERLRSSEDVASLRDLTDIEVVTPEVDAILRPFAVEEEEPTLEEVIGDYPVSRART